MALKKKKEKEQISKQERLATRAKAKFTVFPVKEPMELMDFLMKTMAGISRNTAKSLLSKRQVLVDNVITTSYNFPLKAGMKVLISKEKGKKEFHSSLLKIVYEDDYLIIIDKREGLLSMGTNSQKERTAHSILNDYVQRSGKQYRIYIVHRLDKDTSGLMVFAKDEKTKFTLQDYWDEIVKDRRYVAVVSGEIEKDNGTITSWLKDNKVYVTYSSMTNNGGEKAITHYKTIKRNNGYSLLELDLETGRKNQIRVHMQDMQHPVLGDVKYGDGNNPIGRLALHAFKLCLYHPITGELMKFETPYPSSFKKLVLKAIPKEDKE
ncbi:RluA family pseudouridine synthase [uncultured Bacteroides sp.]|uniref:RluA family pseudouridine synthase n=1 Tax=uncultured Bacteroides sp. TaxID=162156 RepID=UPI002AAB9AED|nr:RluA family pseudouridine synthase [uncultured Bacteroides sp.]